MNNRQLGFIASVVILVVGVAYIELTACWSCNVTGIALYIFGIALTIVFISFFSTLLYGGIVLRDFARMRKLRKPGSMTLPAMGFDFAMYLSAIRDRLIADGFDVEERPDVSKLEAAWRLTSSLASEISRLELGLLASKREGRAKGVTFCALIQAEGVTVEFVERVIQSFRQLSMLKTKVTNEAARTFFPVIVSSRFGDEVTRMVEKRKVVEMALVNAERKGISAILFPNPLGARGMYLAIAPVLVATETGRIFFNRKVNYVPSISASFQNRARDKVREYFAANGMK